MDGPLSLGQVGSKSINNKLITVGTAPVETVRSQGTLTIAEAVTAGDTMVIGHTPYIFVADGTAAVAGDIDMGADEAATKLNIVKAIKGTDSVNGANLNTDCASAFSTDALVLTAKSAGAKGDLIPTTETFTHVSNVFDDVTLGTTTAGVGAAVDVAYAVGDMIFATDTAYLCTAKDAYNVTTWMYWTLTAL